MSNFKSCENKNVVQGVFLYLLISLLATFLSSCAPKSSPQFMDEAQQLLWSDPEACLSFLDSIYPNLSSPEEQQYWHLCHEHASLRVNRWIENDSLLENLAQTFQDREDYRCAGEANYLLGTYYILHNQVSLAVYRLKDAEFYLHRAQPTDTNLLGITLYRLGTAFEREHLYDYSASQFCEALPLLMQCDNKLYAASCYRDIALQRTDLTIEQKLVNFDTALVIFSQTPHTTLQQIEVRCRMLELHDTTTAELIDCYKFLCDSFPSFNNAQGIIFYYLEQNQLDSCYKYLKILEQDTCYSEWSKENYLHLCAMYYERMGNFRKADDFHNACYYVMKNQLYYKIQSQTVVISQQYDLSKEKEKAMLAQIARQRERLLLATIVIILAIVCIVLLVVYYRHKIRYQQKIQQQSLDIVTLTAQNDAKQHALKAKLNYRIQQAQQEHKSSLLTKGYSREELEQIKQEFELVYNNQLQTLQQQYNKLTEMDTYVMMLIVLGYDIQDCCVLLNMQKATLWQRRKRIKQHLGLDAETDIEEWLRETIQ